MKKRQLWQNNVYGFFSCSDVIIHEDREIGGNKCTVLPLRALTQVRRHAWETVTEEHI